MPWKLRKAPRQEAYWVVNEITGKHYSHEPLPKETAIKQMRQLYRLDSEEPPVKKLYPNRARVVKGSDEAKEKMKKAREARTFHKKPESETS
jgi:hypothetical protein